MKFSLNKFNGIKEVQWPIDGLYCLSNCNDHYILWNPASMQFRTLPLPHPHFLPHVEAFRGVIGFGIDPLTHDYKLVLLRYFTSENEIYPDVYLMVYNLSTNTWRLLNRECEHNLDNSRNSTFVNGTYYWWQVYGEVIAFDMREEKFREIPGPEISECSSYLTLYKDGVALMVLKDLFVDIWVMLEEGVWINQFSIERPSMLMYVIGLWKYDCLLDAHGSKTDIYEDNSQLVLYNMNTQEIRTISPTGVGRCFQASVYYESLVSVDSGTEHKGIRASLDVISEFLSYDHSP